MVGMLVDIPRHQKALSLSMDHVFLSIQPSRDDRYSGRGYHNGLWLEGEWGMIWQTHLIFGVQSRRL